MLKSLADGLADQDHGIAVCAAIGLGKAGDVLSPTVSSKAALDILKTTTPQESRYCCVKNNIILALGLTRDASVTESIKTIILNNKEPVVLRAYAALAAGYLDAEPEISQILKDVLGDKDDGEVRSCACLALGNLKDISAIAVLSKVLNSNKSEKKEPTPVRAFAALALGRLGTKEAVKELKKCAQSNERDLDVRSAVVTALGLTGLPETKDILVPFLNDRMMIIKGLAAVSLVQSRAKQVDEIIIEALHKTKSNDADGLMVIALGLTGSEKAKTELRKILETEKKRNLLKAAAAIGLGLLRDTDAAPTIVKVLKNEKFQGNITLIPYLILTLGMIGDPQGVEVLEQLWREVDKNISVKSYTNLAIALTMLGKRQTVVEQLVRQADDSDVILSASALHTLGLVGDAESARKLVEYSRSERLFVRFAALSAIGFILDKDAINPITRITANNIDIQMPVINRILPIPVW